MANEWFFRWHGLKEEEGMTVDGFDGRQIRMGGNLQFWGTPRDVYWQTLSRYIAVEIEKRFKQLQSETVSYPLELKLEAARDFEAIMERFNAQIAEMAMEKDRLLRGDGITFPNPDQSAKHSLIQIQAIRERVGAFIRLEQAKAPVFQKQNVLDKSKKWTFSFALDLLKGLIKTQIKRFTGVDV